MNMAPLQPVSVKAGRIFLVTLLLLISLALVMLIAGRPQAVQAADFTINTLIDEKDNSCSDGDCSLRDAISSAFIGDTIDFSVNGTIVLSPTLGEIIISTPLHLNGPGVAQLTISGNGSTRIFVVQYGMVFNLQDITLANGFTSDKGAAIFNAGQSIIANTVFLDNQVDTTQSFGGAIYNDAGILNITNCIFTNNRATSIESYGGGIYNNNGEVHIANTTFSRNFAVSEVLAKGGAIYTYLGTLVIENSTFFSNTASSSDVNFGDGGGIYNYNTTLTITHATFSNNYASHQGSNILDTGGTTTAENSIFANSLSTPGCYGTITGSLTDNLRWPGTETCPGRLGDPKLAPLTDNGGSTPTMALLSDSQAIDKSACLGLPGDQRNMPRPVDVPWVPNVGAGCDTGAFEVQILKIYLPLVQK